MRRLVRSKDLKMEKTQEKNSLSLVLKNTFLTDGCQSGKGEEKVKIMDHYLRGRGENVLHGKKILQQRSPPFY